SFQLILGIVPSITEISAALAYLSIIFLKASLSNMSLGINASNPKSVSRKDSKPISASSAMIMSVNSGLHLILNSRYSILKGQYDVHKVPGFQRSTADQPSVHVGFGKDFPSIIRFKAASV